MNKTKDTLYINIILSISNLAVFPALFLQLYKGYYFSFLLSCYTAVFSAIYHIFETKFYLNGIQKKLGFCKYIDDKIYVPMLLNFDRFFSFLSVIYHLIFFYDQIKYYIGWTNIFLSFSFMSISEIFGKYGYINMFMITHLIWHLSAYYFLFCIYL